MQIILILYHNNEPGVHFRTDVRICVATRVLRDTLQHNKVIAMTILYSSLTKGGYSEKKKKFT